MNWSAYDSNHRGHCETRVCWRVTGSTLRPLTNVSGEVAKTDGLEPAKGADFAAWKIREPSLNGTVLHDTHEIVLPSSRYRFIVEDSELPFGPICRRKL